jgi:pimeloyl-ACP methyl ester carboxylesterase
MLRSSPVDGFRLALRAAWRVHRVDRLVPRRGGGTVARSLSESAPAPHERISVPAAILWPEHDPLFPQAWADRLDAFFSDATVQHLSGVGHFVPLEAPQDFASAIQQALDTHAAR